MELLLFIPAQYRRTALLAAQSDDGSVLIHGATGTGKSALARWIHGQSIRALKPFKTYSRQMPLSQQLIEAQGGTLLVGEVGELRRADQQILCQYLAHKTVPHPSSERLPMLLNVRVMASSTYSLESRVQGGLFNAELLERLGVFRIEMPPLQKRLEDFGEIVSGLIGEITRELHREHVRGISTAALSRLRGYLWPGNLRELRNVLRVAVIQARTDRVELTDLPEFEDRHIDFRATREQFERTYILELLKTFNWEIDRTCQISQMDRATLVHKMQKYGLEGSTRSMSMT